MSPAWRRFLPGYLLALAHTVVGLALALVYRSHSWRWSDGCMEALAGRLPDGRTRIWGRPSAQTHGWLILYADARVRESPRLRAHERVHVVQGFVGGPLFPIAYGLSFLVLFAADRFRSWRNAYLAIPFERHARAVEGRPGAWGS